jgi:PPP family 3-phenylpropionic acid transporter
MAAEKSFSGETSRLWPSLAYFIIFSAVAAYAPFLALYYRSLGLSGGQVGFLLGIPPLITIFASPFLTGIADTTKRHKTLLIIAILICVGMMSAVPFIESFALIFVVIAIFAFFSAPTNALIDSATLTMLGDKRAGYGRIRMWGTIGWGISAPIVGEVLQRYGLFWIFWIYAGLMVLILLPISQLRFEGKAAAVPFWRGMQTLFSNRQWLLFMLMVFITAIGVSSHTSYMSVLMEGLGASRGLIGITLSVSTVAELPIMFFSMPLLRKLKATGLLAVAVAVTGVRCLLYALAGGPGAVLAIQLLHGLTFPALWIAGVTYAAENAPEGRSATAQGVFSSVLMGLGSATGNLLGGVLIEHFGVAGMFGIAGGIVLLGLLVLFPLLQRSIVSSARVE